MEIGHHQVRVAASCDLLIESVNHSSSLTYCFSSPLDSGTISYDSVLRQNVMSLKRGEVARQEISSSATPGASYSFGFWARLLNSDKAITLKVIIRMRFTNNDLIYGPCKNPICNLYERPVTATMAGGTSQWQHIIAETFEMYGNYTAWNGTADFILFQVLTAGMPHSAELRIANFHDLTESTVPPSMSMVPSTSPTTLNIEDVAYVISYAGDVRTVVYHPFQIDDTGEVLPMDGSVKYVLCEVEEVEGSLSESPKGMGFVVDDLCTRIRGGNPTVSHLMRLVLTGLETSCSLFHSFLTKLFR